MINYRVVALYEPEIEFDQEMLEALEIAERYDEDDVMWRSKSEVERNAVRLARALKRCHGRGTVMHNTPKERRSYGQIAYLHSEGLDEREMLKKHKSLAAAVAWARATSKRRMRERANDPERNAFLDGIVDRAVSLRNHA